MSVFPNYQSGLDGPFCFLDCSWTKGTTQQNRMTMTNLYLNDGGSSGTQANLDVSQRLWFKKRDCKTNIDKNEPDITHKLARAPPDSNFKTSIGRDLCSDNSKGGICWSKWKRAERVGNLLCPLSPWVGSITALTVQRKGKKTVIED